MPLKTAQTLLNQFLLGNPEAFPDQPEDVSPKGPGDAVCPFHFVLPSHLWFLCRLAVASPRGSTLLPVVLRGVVHS